MANYDLTYEGSRVQGILDTGDELRDAGYIFRGEATPSTVPGTPTERVAYIGGPGTYTNFGSSTVVPSGSIGVFKYTGSAWSNEVIACTVPISTSVQNNDTTVPTGKAVKTAVDGAVGDEATARGNAVSAEATAREQADTALQNAINAINNNIGNGYVYAGVATPSTSPVTGKVFYLAVTAGTYTNFGNAVVTAGLNVIKYNGSVWSVDQVIAIDAEPTQGSDHLVKSGGVLKSIIQNGPAFDLSAYNAQGGVLATYADLSAALTALNALPADFKKGGMSMKFVLSSDNKYAQYRLLSDSFNTNTDNWSFCGDNIISKNPEFIEVETDSEDKILEARKTDGTKVEYSNLEVKGKLLNKELEERFEASEKKLSFVELQNNPEWFDVDIDEDGNILGGIRKDGGLYITEKNLNKIRKRVLALSPSERYSYQKGNLNNACRINKDGFGSKDFMALILADNHADNQSVINAVDIGNNNSTIDVLIHVGDIEESTYDEDYARKFFNTLSKSEKPYLVVLGNHDVGNTMRVNYGATHEDSYNTFIKPIVDAGILKAGEYEIGKSYYFHDFDELKTRAIVIYEYECPLDVADNEYWEEVAYNASYPQIKEGYTYTYDSNNPTIVNCGHYKGGSFKLKQTVTTTSGQYEDDNTIPKYKCGRSDRVIMQDQAQWFVNTLANTPDGYGIVVLTHNPAMKESTNQVQYKFAMNEAYSATTFIQSSMSTDLLSDIVDAFINKTAKDIKVVMSSSGWHESSAEYLNTLNDGSIDYCYELSVDFTNRSNPNSYFMCYIGGHVHKDLVFKHNTYTDQFAICPTTMANDYWDNAASDIAKPYPKDEIFYDSLTAVSLKRGRIALARIGVDTTINGDKRDFEVINL